MVNLRKNFLENKKVIIMGGGTSGWTTALYFLHHSLTNNLNIDVQVVSSENIGVIGVGEGTTPSYAISLMEMHCKIPTEEFLRETKGSMKYGIKFANWNFDKEYYYHMFSGSMCGNETYYLSQYAIDNGLDITQKQIQKKIHGYLGYSILETDSIPIQDIEKYQYSYHFSSDLLIKFLRRKCEEFQNFSHQEGMIRKVLYDERGYIKKLCLDDDICLDGDFFVNCLGFHSQKILSEEYFDLVLWDNYILNNSAFAIQVKNEENEPINFYTSCYAQEYGWTWKIPQYEKTGYGYVFSDHFINDESKLYEDIIKTFNIKEENIIGSRMVKSKPYFNKKQLHKNCLSIGLSSGFVEPLEATSLHLINSSLNGFSEISVNDTQSRRNFNKKMEEEWNNVFEFIIYHYLTKNPKNDYWKHYNNISKDKLVALKMFSSPHRGMFTKENYTIISLGMKRSNTSLRKQIKENLHSISEQHTYENLQSFDQEKNFNDELKMKEIITHKQLLNEINMGQSRKYFDKKIK